MHSFLFIFLLTGLALSQSIKINYTLDVISKQPVIYVGGEYRGLSLQYSYQNFIRMDLHQAFNTSWILGVSTKPEKTITSKWQWQFHLTSQISRYFSFGLWKGSGFSSGFEFGFTWQ